MDSTNSTKIGFRLLSLAMIEYDWGGVGNVERL